MLINGLRWLKMSRIERNDTKTSNSGRKIKSFWQNGKKGTFFFGSPFTLQVVQWLKKDSIWNPLDKDTGVTQLMWTRST